MDPIKAKIPPPNVLSSTEPRKLPNQRRSEKTVEGILDAAIAAIHESGYSATTNQIAKRAGVSIGTLYQYYPNKESIVTELFRRHRAIELVALSDGLAAGQADEASSSNLILEEKPDLNDALLASFVHAFVSINLTTLAGTAPLFSHVPESDWTGDLIDANRALRATIAILYRAWKSTPDLDVATTRDSEHDLDEVVHAIALSLRMIVSSFARSRIGNEKLKIDSSQPLIENLLQRMLRAALSSGLAP